MAVGVLRSLFSPRWRWLTITVLWLAVVVFAQWGISHTEPRMSIWDRLYRGDKSRAERGLGLGLSLVRAIVQAHGGTVAVESSPGQGARFEVRLPGSERRVHT